MRVLTFFGIYYLIESLWISLENITTGAHVVTATDTVVACLLAGALNYVIWMKHDCGED